MGARLLPIELIEDLFAACGSKNGPADVSYRLRPHLILVDINKEVRFYQNLVVQAVYTVIGVVVADEIANAVDHGLFVVKPLQQFAGYGRALDFLVIPPLPLPYFSRLGRMPISWVMAAVSKMKSVFPSRFSRSAMSLAKAHTFKKNAEPCGGAALFVGDHPLK